ncbi:MAG: hypothetical protein J6J36_06655 [Clostridia bacterium]|nr:hypothetical protein [Clostridia bacterium]
MNTLVAFRNNEEDNICYGILTENGTIICLHCLKTTNKEDCEIIEENINIYHTSIDTLLQEEVYDYNTMEN